MVSEMAKEDIHALEKQGVKLSFDEIIRLNSFGVKAEKSANSYSFFCLPRCVFLRVEDGNDVVLREPTIGHEIWYDSVVRQFDIEDNFTLLSLRAYMMSKDADELPEWYHISEVKSAIERFVKKDIKRFSIRQIINAMEYCINGNDPNAEKIVEVECECGDVVDNNEPEREGTSSEIGIMREAQSIGLGISMKEMKTMTSSDLQNTILLKYRAMEIDVDKKIKEEAIGNYYRLLEQIKQAHKKEEEEEKDEVIQNG